MDPNNLPENDHFNLHALNEGTYACIHKPGGAAYSNAGIIDLGGFTMVVDALHTQAAALALREAAELLFGRGIDMLILTHAHPDHWIGAQAFDQGTSFISGETVQEACMKQGPQILEDFQDPEIWEEWFQEVKAKLQEENDEHTRTRLEKDLSFIRYIQAERKTFQPRYPDQTFKDIFVVQGDERKAEIRSMGKGHSEEDVVVLLPQDQVAFLGDIGFFDSQPYLGSCEIDLYRKQLLFFKESDYSIFIPGHGPVGSKKEIEYQLSYFDLMEDQVSRIVEKGGSFEEALQITLPEPYQRWRLEGTERFQTNVRYLFKHFGGEIPPEE